MNFSFVIPSYSNLIILDSMYCETIINFMQLSESPSRRFKRPILIFTTIRGKIFATIRCKRHICKLIIYICYDVRLSSRVASSIRNKAKSDIVVADYDHQHPQSLI